ncbi:septum formation family protein [Nocardioides cheoyonin]|uniref:septum formation family protein n=1 Tax=Nocardioides cheoyonin TaxID=3156615 RepID=UPI0032B610DC
MIRPRPYVAVPLALPVLLAAFLLAGCSGGGTSHGADPAQVDSTEVPSVGTCRNLTRADVARPTNASPLVACDDPHNAETYAAGRLPKRFADVKPDDDALSDWVYDRCTVLLEKHLGADQSLLMRSMLSWVWFGPSDRAWEKGARWFRCDLVGGGESGAPYVDLPTNTTNMLRGKNIDDRWMVCARGASVNSTKVPCSEKHAWRAVTTIKLGEPKDSYPGDDTVKTKTRSYCADSVKAWLGYPESYDYGYTWFGEDEWDAGNRRSVCWAKTDK